MMGNQPADRPPAAPPPTRPSLRVLAGATLLVLAALLPAISVVMQYVTAGFEVRSAPDPISAFDERLAPLRAVLGDTPRVGYLAPPRLGADRAAAHLYLMRYALAPVVVTEDAGATLVVADGRRANDIPAGYRIARDFGGGLLLLRAEASPP